MFYKASDLGFSATLRAGSGLAGAVDPANLRPVGSNGTPACWRRSLQQSSGEMIYCSYRDVLLVTARRGPAEKYRDKGSSVGYNSRLNLSYFEYNVNVMIVKVK